MQHINLYQQRFYPQRTGLSAPVVLAVWLVLLASLWTAQWYLQRKNSLLELELQTARQEQTANEKLLETLLRTMPAKTASPLLAQESERLEKERNARQAVLRALQGKDGRSAQFSRYLEALARQHVPGLWLTHVRISDSGRRLGVKGKTVDGKLAPEYLKRLKSETVFGGTPFNTFEISRAGDEAGRLSFTLYSLSAAQLQAQAQAAGKGGESTASPDDVFLTPGAPQGKPSTPAPPGVQLLQKFYTPPSGGAP